MINHLIVNVIDLDIVAPYTLRVSFDDGTQQTINFEPVLYGYYYGPLRDLDEAAGATCATPDRDVCCRVARASMQGLATTMAECRSRWSPTILDGRSSTKRWRPRSKPRWAPRR